MEGETWQINKEEFIPGIEYLTSEKETGKYINFSEEKSMTFMENIYIDWLLTEDAANALDETMFNGKHAKALQIAFNAGFNAAKEKSLDDDPQMR